MMGAVIAATAAVIHEWRLGGGCGLDRPRVALKISAAQREAGQGRFEHGWFCRTTRNLGSLNCKGVEACTF